MFKTFQELRDYFYEDMAKGNKSQKKEVKKPKKITKEQKLGIAGLV